MKDILDKVLQMIKVSDNTLKIICVDISRISQNVESYAIAMKQPKQQFG